MDIVVSANNNEEVLVFPTVPKGAIDIDAPQHSKEVATINGGALNLIGNFGLRSLSLNHIWPERDYTWIKEGVATGGELITFFNKWREKRVPIRIVITNDDGTEFINMPVTVDSFSYGKTRSGDIKYSLEFKEFTFVKGA